MIRGVKNFDRNGIIKRPICLLLVNKNEDDESQMLVTEAMLIEKSMQSGFEGAITISNKAMTQN